MSIWLLGSRLDFPTQNIPHMQGMLLSRIVPCDSEACNLFAKAALRGRQARGAVLTPEAGTGELSAVELSAAPSFKAARS